MQLEAYLQAIVNVRLYRNHRETAEFLEVSHMSFINNIGAKMKEGLIKKRPGGRRTFSGIKRFCIAHCARWGERWLLVKDSFIAYLHPSNEEIRAVILYDPEFTVKCGSAAAEGIKHGLLITNRSRFLFLKCENDQVAADWASSIQKFVGDRGKAWLNDHRFLSFAPNRESVYAQWFVDGRSFLRTCRRNYGISQGGNLHY